MRYNSATPETESGFYTSQLPLEDWELKPPGRKIQRLPDPETKGKLALVESAAIGRPGGFSSRILERVSSNVNSG